VDLGNVRLHRRKKQVVTLQNVGPVKLQVGTISYTVTSGNPADFTYHSYCRLPLRVGKSCTVAVLFYADAVSTDSATLNIASSAANSPLQVPITVTVVK